MEAVDATRMEAAKNEILERTLIWQQQFRRDSMEGKLAGGAFRPIDILGRACSLKNFLLALLIFGTVCYLNVIAPAVLIKYGIPLTPDDLETLVEYLVPESLEALFESTFSVSEFYSRAARFSFEDAIKWFKKFSFKKMFEQSQKISDWLLSQVAEETSRANYAVSLATRIATYLTFATLSTAISFISTAYELIILLCTVLTVMEKLIGIINSLARAGYRLASCGRVVQEALRRQKATGVDIDTVLAQTAAENAIPEAVMVPGLRRRF